jgi:hypothetical protein
VRYQAALRPGRCCYDTTVGLGFVKPAMVLVVGRFERDWKCFSVILRAVEDQMLSRPKCRNLLIQIPITMDLGAWCLDLNLSQFDSFTSFISKPKSIPAVAAYTIVNVSEGFSAGR